MIATFNEHMAKIFLVLWVLGELMSIWHNRWTCPGWLFCPRKPHPFGNEYHTACCGLLGIPNPTRFCVLRALFKLKKVSLSACAVIKKR